MVKWVFFFYNNLLSATPVYGNRVIFGKHPDNHMMGLVSMGNNLMANDLISHACVMKPPLEPQMMVFRELLGGQPCEGARRWHT